MKRAIPCIVAASAILAGSLVARADAIDDAAKELDAAYAKLKSYRAKVKTVQDIDMSGMKMKTDSAGTMEARRQPGKKAQYRNEMSYDSSTTMGDKVEKTSAKVLMVSDGQFAYTMREDLAGPQKGTKNVIKTNATDDTNGFNELRQHHVVKLMPDETIDGHPCFVIEARTKGPDGKPVGDQRFIWYFRKDIGITVKTVFIMGGKTQSTSNTTDIEVNPTLGDDRFKFTPPPGVEINDMTKNQPMSGGHTATEKPATAKPETAKPEEKKPADTPKDEKKPDGPKMPKLPRLP